MFSPALLFLKSYINWFQEKHRSKERTVSGLDILWFRIKSYDIKYFGQAYFFFTHSKKKKAWSANMSELRNFYFDSFGTSEILYTEYS